MIVGVVRLGGGDVEAQPTTSVTTARNEMLRESVFTAEPPFVPLFPDWAIPPVDVNIVLAGKRELSPNVRAFVDVMKERLGAPNDDGLLET